jgi:hypothetical protein
MGAWGVESCSSDSCWDLLGGGGIKDIHDVKQEEVDACMQYTMAAADSSYYPRCKLGVAIWLLDHGMKLSEEQLNWAEAEVDKCITEYDTAMEKQVVPPSPEHIGNLKSERERILAAKQNSGQGQEHHVPGLCENISTMMANSGLGLLNVNDKSAETRDDE